MFNSVSKTSRHASYYLNVDDAHEKVSIFQDENFLKFSVCYEDTNFGNIRVLGEKRTLFWAGCECKDMMVDMPFDGVPFFVLGKKVYKCEIRTRRKRKANKEAESPPRVRCPANLFIFEILKFPEHKIEVDEVEARTKTAKTLLEDMKVGKALAERRFYVFYPEAKDHRSHLVFKDGAFIEPLSLVIKQEVAEGSTEFFEFPVEDERKNDALSDSFLRCSDLLELIKDKTYTSEDMTLAYGLITLKDTLMRLQTLKENGYLNAAPNSR